MRTSVRFQSLVLSSAMLLICSCSRAPVTGRKQLALVPAPLLNRMALQSYEQFLAEHRLSDDQQQTKMVKTVGRRIRRAVQKYLDQTDQSKRIKGFKWEFNLVESPEVNAWAMPGGKVVVYTGIMPITQDEAGLATVLGHEIAHVVAGHGNERVSQGLLVQLGGMALSEALEKRPQQTQELFLKAYGVGTRVGVFLPFSRTHEYEADRLGLIFMAMAGYDPHEAVGFWQRMARQAGGKGGPEFLRTHPTPEHRIERIRELIPEAMEYYKRRERRD